MHGTWLSQNGTDDNRWRHGILILCGGHELMVKNGIYQDKLFKSSKIKTSIENVMISTSTKSCEVFTKTGLTFVISVEPWSSCFNTQVNICSIHF